MKASELYSKFYNGTTEALLEGGDEIEHEIKETLRKLDNNPEFGSPRWYRYKARTQGIKEALKDYQTSTHPGSRQPEDYERRENNKFFRGVRNLPLVINDLRNRVEYALGTRDRY